MDLDDGLGFGQLGFQSCLLSLKPGDLCLCLTILFPLPAFGLLQPTRCLLLSPLAQRRVVDPLSFQQCRYLAPLALVCFCQNAQLVLPAKGPISGPGITSGSVPSV